MILGNNMKCKICEKEVNKLYTYDSDIPIACEDCRKILFKINYKMTGRIREYEAIKNIN